MHTWPLWLEAESKWKMDQADSETGRAESVVHKGHRQRKELVTVVEKNRLRQEESQGRGCPRKQRGKRF